MCGLEVKVSAVPLTFINDYEMEMGEGIVTFMLFIHETGRGYGTDRKEEQNQSPPLCPINR